ncbi:MAG: tRNA epoxyqueuosine(34) reductase QueG [Armatimonadota bacterium]
MSTSDDIKSIALECGFHSAGITTAEPFVESAEVLTSRLEGGMLDGLGFNSERIRRITNPRDVMPEAKSIISVALSYLTVDDFSPDIESGLRGQIARFVRGIDYHHEMKSRLTKLCESLQSRLGIHAEFKAFCDTGPLSDRSIAIWAGIGSQGRNGCICIPRYGSWVVLGEVITNIEIEPHAPSTKDICGNCRKCIDACPTGAISESGAVDARICLSQVTQSKGSIPQDMRSKLKTRIYGCDTCQEVCPLNKQAECGDITAFRWQSGLGGNPLLLPLININAIVFKTAIAPTTAGWIGRTRFRRNAIIASGNAGDPEAVHELIAALTDSEPVIRGHAAWALGEIGGQNAFDALKIALSIETDDIAVDEIESALKD